MASGAGNNATSGSVAKLNWRKFGMFDKQILTENIGSILENDVVAIKADGGHMFIGDASGNLYQMDRSLQIISKHKIFRGQIFGLSYVLSSGQNTSGLKRQYLLVVGDDSSKTDAVEGVTYVMKSFLVSDMSRAVQAFAVSGLPKGAGITSICTTTDGMYTALGFTTGTLLLYEGDFFKEGSSKAIAPALLLAKHSSLCSGNTFEKKKLFPPTLTLNAILLRDSIRVTLL